ncbi:unnamed protein product [Chondrus crispus]|uniref:Xaa-Pro aminopeptidase P n=1 Tax=Chondrus crispus TaxID=2769 RepID=R7Q599_CHOCR|nr:unnamed protein product [Chondrus crispus]CDF32531.1 unnamed protein product [Chondrus crispus]|eukprot:XP_005712196.1 unnamed protein product [Chondrus crispus]
MMRTHEDPGVEDWVAANMKPGSKVGIDGMTVSINGMKRFRYALAAAQANSSISVEPLPKDVPNLVDQIWASARPAAPASKIVVHPVEYAGVSAKDKLINVRTTMQQKGASMLIVSALDEVAWLLNLRGGDVNYNPVFWAYVTITASSATLYVNNTRFGEGVDEQLKESDVTVSSYDSLLPDLSQACWDDTSRVWMDPNNCNYAILDCIQKCAQGVQLIKKQGPIALAKAKKCGVELTGVRSSHIRDGVALSKFLCWLENEVANLGHEPTEINASDKLDGLRSEQDLFVSLSFPTISSAGANGAVVHYRAEAATAAKITKNDVYLVDSGGQFRDGTTDVTRTMHFGVPTPWQKECFTRVLQGHIAIDRAIFPKGTTGHVLDAFAREPLWKVGMDYKHGTGHGVGSHLNVHEGPHVLSFKSQALGTALEPGFLTSNEPGYYEEGGFGIRIENVCIVREADVKGPPGGSEKPFYGMERVTMTPIQKKMIDVGLLNEKERSWVDEYHKECFEKLEPLLKDDAETLAWLKKETTPLVS